MSDEMVVRSLEEAWFAVIGEVCDLPLAGIGATGWPEKKAIFFAGARLGGYLEKRGVNVAKQYQEYADAITNTDNDH